MAGALRDYHRIVQELLTDYSQIPYLQENLRDETIFDSISGRYMLVTVGWQGRKRINTIVLHIDVHDNQVIIQCNNTDQNIVQELVDAGIPSEVIVYPQAPHEQATLTAASDLATA